MLLPGGSPVVNFLLGPQFLFADDFGIGSNKKRLEIIDSNVPKILHHEISAGLLQQ